MPSVQRSTRATSAVGAVVLVTGSAGLRTTWTRTLSEHLTFLEESEMTFQAIRAHIETRVYSAFQALSPPLEVVFDNTYETPPARPYAVCLISYTSTTEPVVCQTQTAVEDLRGNLQISVYVPRGRGMKALEEYAATAMICINNLYVWGGDPTVKAGQINGPTYLTAGDEPYVVATVSCPFTAHVSGSPSTPGGTTFSVLTNEVDLTNPTRKGATRGKATSKGWFDASSWRDDDTGRRQ